MFTMEEKKNPRDLLDREREFKAGDFVTIDRGAEYPVEACVVDEVNGPRTVIYYLSITEIKDDVYVHRSEVNTSSLIYLGDSYVNYGGMLWVLRDKIMKGRQDDIIVSQFHTEV